jgi:hypothetical protein
MGVEKCPKSSLLFVVSSKFGSQNREYGRGRLPVNTGLAWAESYSRLQPRGYRLVTIQSITWTQACFRSSCNSNPFRKESTPSTKMDRKYSPALCSRRHLAGRIHRTHRAAVGPIPRTQLDHHASTHKPCLSWYSRREMHPNAQYFEVFDVMSRANSSHRREAASPVPPRCT